MNEKYVIKRMILTMKPYSKSLLAIIVLVVIITGMNLVVPLVSKVMIDDGFIKNNYETVISTVVVIFLIIITSEILNIFKDKIRINIKAKLTTALFQDTFRKLTKINLQYYKENNYSEIMEHIGTDIGAMGKIVDESLLLVFAELLKIIGGVIGLVLISWKLALLILIYIPIKLAIMNYLVKKREAIMQEYISNKRGFAHWFGDTVAGMQDIRLYGILKEKHKEFINEILKLTTCERKFSLLDTKNSSAEVVISQLVNGLVYIVGAKFVNDLQLTVGSVLSFVTYSMYVTNPISAITNIGYMLSAIVPSAKRHFEFLDIPDEDNTYDNEKIIGVDSIEFKNVEFSYDDNYKILNNITFSVLKNEKIAIIGANGSGKSTIINLLLRFYRPNKGTITINGKCIEQFNLEDYRSQFGAINQNVHIFDSTIEQNIKMYSNVDEENYINILRESNLYDFEKSLPKNYRVGQNGMMLSGGQRQKIAIARTIIKNKPIVIFDEATSNMDLESEYMINGLFKTKLKDKIVFVITHSIDYIKQYDKVIFLVDGKVNGIGNHNDLILNNKLYKEYIYKIQHEVS